MINGDSEGVTTDMYSLTPLKVQEKAVIDIVFLWLPHRKCMVKILIGCKYCQTFEQKDFEIFLVGQAVLQVRQIFKIVCNSIHELLNIFEDPAQHIHTIVTGRLKNK